MAFISCIEHRRQEGNYALFQKTHITIALTVFGLLATLFSSLGIGKVAPFYRMPAGLKLVLLTSGLSVMAGGLSLLLKKVVAVALEHRRIARLPIVENSILGQVVEAEIELVYGGSVLTRNFNLPGECFRGIAALPSQGAHNEICLHVLSGHPRAVFERQELDTMMKEAILALLDMDLTITGVSSRPKALMAPGGAFSQWQAENRGY